MKELDMLKEVLDTAEIYKIKISKFRYGDLEIELQPVQEIKEKQEVGKNPEKAKRRATALKGLPSAYGHPSLGLIEDDN